VSPAKGMTAVSIEAVMTEAGGRTVVQNTCYITYHPINVLFVSRLLNAPTLRR